MECVNCRSEKVFTQMVPVNKRKRMPFKIFINYVLNSGGIMLFVLPVIGWIVIVLMYLRGAKVSSEIWSICQDCGFQWKQ